MTNAAAAQYSRNKISICSSRNCSYQSSRSEKREASFVCGGKKNVAEEIFYDATAVIFPFMIIAMLR